MRWFWKSSTVVMIPPDRPCADLSSRFRLDSPERESRTANFVILQEWIGVRVRLPRASPVKSMTTSVTVIGLQSARTWLD